MSEIRVIQLPINTTIEVLQLLLNMDASTRFRKENMIWITVKDGLKVSIQAGEGKYSEPQEDYAVHVQVELGFPNEIVREWMPYVENPENPTETVYPYVPLEVVAAAIDRKGGIDFERTTLDLIEWRRKQQKERRKESRTF